MSTKQIIVIAHAVMNIRGQKIFLNDRFGKTDRSTIVALHLIVMFDNVKELLDCYDVLKHGCNNYRPVRGIAIQQAHSTIYRHIRCAKGNMVDENV